jgi:hypothetical protein
MSNSDIDMILRQTNYSTQEAIEKLKLFNNDVIKVIKDYHGIQDKEDKVTSVNQEKFKQFRKKLIISKPTNF